MIQYYKTFKEIYAGWLGEGFQWQMWYISYEGSLTFSKQLECSYIRQFVIQVSSIAVIDSSCSLSRALLNTTENPLITQILPNLIAAVVFFVADEVTRENKMVVVPLFVGVSHYATSKAMRFTMSESVISGVGSMMMALGYNFSMMISECLPEKSEDFNPIVIFPLICCFSFSYDKISKYIKNSVEDEDGSICGLSV